MKVVIPVELIEEAIFENKKDGKKYLSFEVAKLKEADKFGRTHTCYYQTKVNSDNPVQDGPEKQKEANKNSSTDQAQPEEDDLPF